MLAQILAKNPHLEVFSATDPVFSRFGRVVTEYNLCPLLEICEKTDIPAEGNIYVANDEAMLATETAQKMAERFYGGMPIQVGYCNGQSGRLNALEYHKSSEIDVAVTDLVLLLGHVWDIQENRYDSSNVKAFYLPAGTAVELYATTLHFAPCKVQKEGFRCLVVLPCETNTSIVLPKQAAADEEQLLWMRNKWLIAHPESPQAEKGALCGITGDNISVFY